MKYLLTYNQPFLPPMPNNAVYRAGFTVELEASSDIGIVDQVKAFIAKTAFYYEYKPNKTKLYTRTAVKLEQIRTISLKQLNLIDIFYETINKSEGK